MLTISLLNLLQTIKEKKIIEETSKNISLNLNKIKSKEKKELLESFQSLLSEKISPSNLSKLLKFIEKIDKQNENTITNVLNLIQNLYSNIAQTLTTVSTTDNDPFLTKNNDEPIKKQLTDIQKNKNKLEYNKIPESEITKPNINFRKKLLSDISI